MQYFLTITVLVALLWPPPAWSGATDAATGKPTPLLKIVQPVRFGNPVDCTPGRDCWVLNYPDVGPEDDRAPTDPACNARTYDGHKGTDIAIDGTAALMRGVAVRAARDGTVLRVRDGEDDHFPLSEETLAAIKADKKECGNAVLVDHGDGWQAMYCHMKRGSITVTPNQTVKAGDKIGEVGASGMTEFPHLHFGLTRNGIVIDPFTGRDIKEPCAPSTKSASLFSPSAGIRYEPLTFMKSGFHDDAVTLDRLDSGLSDITHMMPDGSALVFYSVMLGARQGDRITLTLTGPDNKIFAQSKSSVGKNRARHMVFTGRKIPENAPLQTGVYTGKIEVERTNDQNETIRLSDKKTITVTTSQ